MYPRQVICACFLRTYCVNLAKTASNMQQIGLVFLLEPGLRWLYPAPKDFSSALLRYLGPSNTHPFMVPLFSGILLAMEKEIAAGSLPETTLDSVRETLATSLSALGDSFCSGTILPLWALGCLLLVSFGMIGWAAVLTLFSFCLLSAFRVGSFWAGLRYGMAALAHLKRMNLINWVGRIKVLNAALAAILVLRLPEMASAAVPQAMHAAGLCAVLLATALIYRRRLPRLLFWLVATGTAIVWGTAWAQKCPLLF